METYRRTGSLMDPVEPTQDERTWGMLAHLSALVASFVALPFLGPLLVMLTRGRESAWVRAQAVEALNFQLTVLLWLALGTALLCLGVGFLLLPVVGALALVLTVVAGVKAYGGEPYRYPATLRLIK